MAFDCADVEIASDRLRIAVSPLGAELRSVQDRDGAQWLWQGSPTGWSGRAPLLFPVIGKSPGGVVTIDGRSFPMPPHGFARTSHFAVVEAGPDRCRLRLRASEQTHAHYPFDFSLDVGYTVRGDLLSCSVEISHAGAHPMPVDFGFHPGFAWPLPGCAAQEPHVLHWTPPAAPRAYRLDNLGQLQLQPVAEMLHDGLLALHPDLFEAGALIFPHGANSPLHYGVPGKPGVRITAEGLEQLGLWSVPGDPFICIEPWHGQPAPAGSRAGDELRLRPGIHRLAPGATWRLGMALEFGAPLSLPSSIQRSIP